MAKRVLAKAAAVMATAAALSVGTAHAGPDEICGPGGCFDHVGSGVCNLIKNKYYSRNMVIRGIMRVTELRASAQPNVETVVDDVIDINCPEVRRLSYF
jgi:hypothetical protein